MNPICHGLLEGVQVFIEQGFRRIYYMGMFKTSRTAVCPLPCNLVFHKIYFFLAKSDKLKQ